MKVKITASSLQNPFLKRRKAVEMVACVILQRITVLGVKLSSHFKLIFGGHSQKGHKFCPFFGQKWGGGGGGAGLKFSRGGRGGQKFVCNRAAAVT